MQKIEGEVDGLGDNHEKASLNNEKAAIQAKVDGRAKGLEDRIMDYSHTTGLKVSGLVNQVNNLEKQQKEQIATQRGQGSSSQRGSAVTQAADYGGPFGSALAGGTHACQAFMRQRTRFRQKQTVHATAASSKNS